MNPVIDAILSRRTVHDFLDEPVSTEAVEIALECALRAPNHKLTNPWRFFRANTDQRSAIADIAVEVKAEKRPVTESQQR